MGTALGKPSDWTDSHGEDAASATRVRGECETAPDLPELYRLSNSYKEGSFGRVLAKCALAGAAGLVVGPIANRGPFLNTAVVSSANAALVVGFYDLIREALTATTVCDTPFISGTAGALTGVSAPHSASLFVFSPPEHCPFVAVTVMSLNYPHKKEHKRGMYHAFLGCCRVCLEWPSPPVQVQSCCRRNGCGRPCRSTPRGHAHL